MKLALEHFNRPWLPISGLIIFMICFAAYTYWTFKKENKGVYDHASMIPLEEEKNERR
ncbi:MAG: cbb3-type cytochrome c oxidase subunit 3 [Rhizobacter sp.]|nr:cbb3-type cytochrome c oxidase subunit 3 [Bacteriovorax sp.]